MKDDNTTIAWWLVRWMFLLLAVPGASQRAHAEAPRLGPFELPKPRELTIPRDTQHFAPFEALNGSLATAALCAQMPHGLWTEIDDRADCIRYYPHGLTKNPNPTMLVYFGGDVMLRTPKGVRFVTASYAAQSPATIAADMKNWSEQAGQPAVFIARPGIYGSSGDHNQRRHQREMGLMDRALDLIKERYQVSNFILAGHSAGGQIVAALLNRRSDISAAVITSGLVSVKQVSAFWEKRRKLPGWLLYNSKSFYDPVSEVDQIRKSPPPAIYMISDPEDRVVPFFSQLYYVRRLRNEGFAPHHIYATAADPRRHVLADHGRLAAALLARGRNEKDIRRALLERELKAAE